MLRCEHAYKKQSACSNDGVLSVVPEAFRNACQTDPTFKGGPKPRKGLLGLTQERISRTMHLLIKDDNHGWILEITVT